MDQDAIQLARTLLALGFVGVGMHLVGQLCAHLKLRARARVTNLEPAPKLGISILKPIKGIDPGLYENLASFARQDYPDFEILIAIDDPADPAVPVVRQVQREFPKAPIQLVVRPNRAGLNPKVNNLLSIEPRARHSLLLISDSNVRVGPDYLRRTVAAMSDPRVGLVSNPIRGVGADALGARLESHHFNTFVISGVCMADRLRMPCVIGKSMMLRREALDAIGGLDAVRDVLAEDYVLGHRVRQAGWRVVLSDYAVDDIHPRWSLERFFLRHQRWAQIRLWGEPGAFALELISFASLWLLLAGAFAIAASAPGLAALAGAGLATLGLADALMSWRLEGRLHFGFALRPLRELVLFVAWWSAWFKREVTWRGRRLRIGRGTTLTPIEEVSHAQRAA